jgi:hypothetical protein
MARITCKLVFSCFVEQLRAKGKAHACLGIVFFMGGVYVVPQVVTCISEQTAQATHQSTHEKCLHDVLASAFSHFDQTRVTFNEGNM